MADDLHFDELQFGDKINQYVYIEELGEGTFSKVVRAWDSIGDKDVCIKITKKEVKYRDAALLEVELLVYMKMNSGESSDRSCVQLLEWLEWRDHICMVFPLYGPSLSSVIRIDTRLPFGLDDIRTIAKDVLEALSFLHSLQFVHTDIKTENIILSNVDWCVRPLKDRLEASGRLISGRFLRNPRAHLCDFGSACAYEDKQQEDQQQPQQQQQQQQLQQDVQSSAEKGESDDEAGWGGVITTRPYRAPEVLLRHPPWGPLCDVWSLGCCLVELFTGVQLFPGTADLLAAAPDSASLLTRPVPPATTTAAAASTTTAATSSTTTAAAAASTTTAATVSASGVPTTTPPTTPCSSEGERSDSKANRPTAVSPMKVAKQQQQQEEEGEDQGGKKEQGQRTMTSTDEAKADTVQLQAQTYFVRALHRQGAGCGGVEEDGGLGGGRRCGDVAIIVDTAQSVKPGRNSSAPRTSPPPPPPEGGGSSLLCSDSGCMDKCGAKGESRGDSWHGQASVALQLLQKEPLFLDLVRRMVDWLPPEGRRCTAREALEHPFFTGCSAFPSSCPL